MRMWRIEADAHFVNLSRRHNRARINPLTNLDHEEFLNRYIFSKSTVTQLSDDLRQKLTVCVALRFFATGDFLKEVGDLHGVSDRTASRCIDRVWKCVV